MPLPPPPPPPVITQKCPEIIDNPSNNVVYPSPGVAPYYMTAQAHVHASANQSWWIPTEVDTSDVYKQWYESAYKAALQAAHEKDTSGKSKVKYLKRKAEIIDPKSDAGILFNKVLYSFILHTSK